jgi:Mg-chelatase subunit ChlD
MRLLLIVFSSLLLSLLSGCSDSDGKEGDGGSSEAGPGEDGVSVDGQVWPGMDGSDGIGPGPDARVDAEDNCGTSPFEATQREVNVLLVIDKSGSMADTPEGFSDDKWTALKSALRTALDRSKNDMAFGLELFPNPRKCEMPEGSDMDVTVHAGSTSMPKIMDKLNKVLPDGGTPTAVALERALEYFTSGEGAALEGDRYVLLATDGGPNCNQGEDCGTDECTVNLDGQCPEQVTNCCDPDEAGEGAQEYCLDEARTLEAIEALAAAGIPTFVVGIPGSEEYADSLDKMAEAGGAANPEAPPSYFAVSASGGVGGLASVLTDITAGLITTCRFQLESDPPDLDRLNVEVDGETLPQAGEDGWEIDFSTSPPTIEVKGATCETIEIEGAEKVRIVYGCPTIE